MKVNDCIFCNIHDSGIILKNENAFAINDKYPHSKGHLLIIPYQHFENFFEIPGTIQSSMIELLNKAGEYCKEKYKPSGYNININNGASAGQIIMHTHIHLIPRYN